MGPRRTRSAPTWWLLLFSACAAASPVVSSAVRIEAGRRTRILLSDLRSGQTLVLQNLSSGSRSEVYGDSQGNASVKVVADDTLQQLIDVLAAQGMFAQSTAMPAPGARAVLAVEQPGRNYVWSRPDPAAATLEQVRAFDEGRGYVMAVYNSETSYHQRDVDALPKELRQKIEQAKSAGNDQGPPR
jgi:hypothetical protein